MIRRGRWSVQWIYRSAFIKRRLFTMTSVEVATHRIQIGHPESGDFQTVAMNGYGGGAEPAEYLGPSDLDFEQDAERFLGAQQEIARIMDELEQDGESDLLGSNSGDGVELSMWIMDHLKQNFPELKETELRDMLVGMTHRESVEVADDRSNVVPLRRIGGTAVTGAGVAIDSIDSRRAA